MYYVYKVVQVCHSHDCFANLVVDFCTTFVPVLNEFSYVTKWSQRFFEHV